MESGFSIRESTRIQELCFEVKPFHLTKHWFSSLHVRYFRMCSISKIGSSLLEEGGAVALEGESGA